MTVQKHKHAELIHAWADGAEIQGLSVAEGNIWRNDKSPEFLESISYRIKPYCEYAIEKIRNIGGDEAVELYIYWLEGNELDLFEEGEWHTTSLDEDEDYSPYEWFKSIVDAKCKIRKKKKTVKQVLWVLVNSEKNLHSEWFDEDCEANYDTWHKVPTCTREVEV